MCNAGAMAAIGAVGAVMSGVSSYQQSQAAAKAAEYQASIDTQNAAIAQGNAVNERQSGIDNARKLRMQMAQNIASQKTAMAANGLDINSGSAFDLLDTTKYFGEMDALTTINNSNIKANAYEAQGMNFLEQAGVSKMTADNYKRSSLLSGLGTTTTGLGQVNSSWYNFNKTNTSLGTKSKSTGGLQS